MEELLPSQLCYHVANRAKLCKHKKLILITYACMTVSKSGDIYGLGGGGERDLERERDYRPCSQPEFERPL